MGRLLTRIVDNIQVTIKNIHIRYEDAELIPNKPFSFGFTLQELSINTTNQKWELAFVDRLVNENRDKPLFKRLKIEGFALYL